jgi:hypothetical protein
MEPHLTRLPKFRELDTDQQSFRTKYTQDSTNQLEDRGLISYGHQQFQEQHTLLSHNRRGEVDPLFPQSLRNQNHII